MVCTASPLNSFLLNHTDVHKVANLRKKQSMARVQHDAALNDLIALQKKNDTQRIPMAQRQCVATKEKYH